MGELVGYALETQKVDDCRQEHLPLKAVEDGYLPLIGEGIHLSSCHLLGALPLEVVEAP